MRSIKLLQCRTIPTINSTYSSIITLSKRYNTTKEIPNKETDPRTKDYFCNYRENQLSSVSYSSEFDPTNTAQVFRSLSTFQLIKYNLMFSILSIKPLTDTMIKIMIDSLDNNINNNNTKTMLFPGSSSLIAIVGIFHNILVVKPLLYLIRKQYYPLFTGGENIDECINCAKKYYDNNIRLIIDNSTEEGTTHDVYQRNLLLKQKLVDVSHNKLRKSVQFMNFKTTAISSPKLLEEMTDILNRKQPIDRDPTPFMNDKQLKELEYTMSMLIKLCKYTKNKGIGIWLDAEQYSRQPAVNYLSRRLMKIINNEPN
eukprot:236519_1